MYVDDIKNTLTKLSIEILEMSPAKQFQTFNLLSSLTLRYFLLIE